jgi:hypothetical protein
MGIFTKALAVVGALLVWLPIAATVVFGAIGSIRSGMLRVDYLMPAELFPAALAGAVFLLWASLRARSRRALFLLGLALMVGLLLGSQALAVETGLASGEIEPEGWPWILVIAMLSGYTLALAAVAVGGALLVRDLFQRSGKGDAQ